VTSTADRLRAAADLIAGPEKWLRYLLPERLRWRIVTLIDRRPNQCWSDLCDWAGTWKNDDPDGFIGWPWFAPWRTDQGHCRDDMQRCGSCYCGKVRDEARIAQIVTEDEDVT
jgi:hypothetical protein